MMIRAMILAAGRGDRMGGLTQNTPKPLLRVGGEPLIVHHIKRLVAAGVQDCLVNLHYLGEKIPEALGDGHQLGLRLHYSYEKEKLETAGGVIQALDFFNNQPFLLISADVFTDYPFERLVQLGMSELFPLAHLVMVDNPAHHREGDFALQKTGYVSFNGEKLNYAGIGIYRPQLFSGCLPGYCKLVDVMKAGILQQQVTGEYYAGSWINVDTSERLALACQLIN